uniref:Ovule protein n=2 Tax=Bursaphelenchus xylophilus TaxID=6326 RepID=A0A1I7S6S7_BURXY
MFDTEFKYFCPIYRPVSHVQLYHRTPSVHCFRPYYFTITLLHTAPRKNEVFFSSLPIHVDVVAFKALFEC